MDERRIGVLTIRAWVEPDHPVPLRAHVARSTDMVAHVPAVESSTDVEHVCGVVRQWLFEILDAPATDR